MLARTAAAPAAAPRKQITYSDEQQAIIQCEDRVVVAEARAGCGKTTTAEGFAHARPNKRVLYICLNAANAAEAKQRFPRNVDAMTTHSLAWGEMRRQVGTRLNRSWKPIGLMKEMNIASARDASNAMRVLNAFFGSTDSDVSDKHVMDLVRERDLNPREQMNAVSLARLAWKRMCDKDDSLSMPDDAYLKMYALRRPQLRYDNIIFDEAQDANPVTAQIVRAQEHAKVLCIGDRHQSIYQFRGSVNAMEQFSIGATVLHLTQTYRFGPKVAEVANLILSEFKGETHLIKGLGADGVWDPRRVAHLSRTNARLFDIAAERKGEGVHWVGGPEKYRMDLVLDAYRLYARDYASIKDRTLRDIGSWADYTKYAEDANDGEAKILVKVIEQYGHDIPDLVDQIVRNAVAIEADADMTLTTGHRSKGMEWNCVKLCDDFEFLADLEFELSQHPDAAIPVADLNLLYVVLTRARHALELNEDTKNWIANLPRHREERRLAHVRAQQERVNDELRMRPR